MKILIFILWLSLSYFIGKKIINDTKKPKNIEKQNTLFWVALSPFETGKVIKNNNVKLDLSKFGIYNKRNVIVEIPELDKRMNFSIEFFQSARVDKQGFDINRHYVFMSFTISEYNNYLLEKRIKEGDTNIIINLLKYFIKLSGNLTIYIV